MRRILVFLLSAALVAGALYAVPAAAQEAPEVPEKANIEDPYGDANTLGGDQVTPVDGGSVSDLGKVWFTHDAENFNVHFLTEGPPGSNTVGLQFEVLTGPENCAVFSGIYDGVTYLSENYGRVVDNCNKLDPVEGEFTFGAGPDGSGLATLTIPRSATPLLADGSTIAAPWARSWIFVGGQQLTVTGYRGVRQRIDDTKPGTDYVITSGESDEGNEADNKTDKKKKSGKKKGCKKEKKGKGKKRGCEGKGKKGPKTGPPADACAPFTPGEMGKEAETTVITDDMTEEKPFEMDVPLGPAAGSFSGVYDRTTRMFHNVQVDTKNNDAGLFVRLETPALEDPDLYAYWPGGSEAARAAGFNPLLAAGPLPEVHPYISGLNGTGRGGHSEFTAEQIDGLRTADCQGWTLDLVNWAGRGGTYKLKVWLGEVQNEPAEEK